MRPKTVQTTKGMTDTTVHHKDLRDTHKAQDPLSKGNGRHSGVVYRPSARRGRAVWGIWSERSCEVLRRTKRTRDRSPRGGRTDSPQTRRPLSLGHPAGRSSSLLTKEAQVKVTKSQRDGLPHPSCSDKTSRGWVPARLNAGNVAPRSVGGRVGVVRFGRVWSKRRAPQHMSSLYPGPRTCLEEEHLLLRLRRRGVPSAGNQAATT